MQSLSGIYLIIEAALIKYLTFFFYYSLFIHFCLLKQIKFLDLKDQLMCVFFNSSTFRKTNKCWRSTLLSWHSLALNKTEAFIT